MERILRTIHVGLVCAQTPSRPVGEELLFRAGGALQLPINNQSHHRESKGVYNLWVDLEVRSRGGIGGFLGMGKVLEAKGSLSYLGTGE